MALAPVKTQDLDEVLSQQLGSFTKLYKLTTPFTTVVNRAQCVDPSKDHAPKFGINRVMTQAVEEVQGEVGPNQERIFKPINDQFDLVRFSGNILNSNDSRGQMVFLNNTTDFIEITFYGTGLNLLIYFDNNSRAIQVTVDGGSASSNLYPSSGSAVLDARNYSTNQIINAASGLTLGTHTVKITTTGSSNSVSVYGYEVLNTTSTLQLVPGTSYNGGKKVINSALTTDTFNSNFESGTLTAATGGHVVVYQKPDGTIKKAIQSNAVGINYLTSANHANESVIRSYSPREFGAGRTDDFTNPALSSISAAAFTLDDGTTTLASGAAQFASIGGQEIVFVASNSTFLQLTFVGTGLDILEIDSNSGGSDTYNIQVDGGATQALHTAGSTTPTITKLVSGLPYGTHIVTINRVTASTWSLGVARFIVYGPSKPSIPTGAVELCDYYLMGSFVANTTLGNTTIGQGMLRKLNTRENIYQGTWTANSVNAGFMSGFGISTSTNGDSISYTFFGTGFDFRWDATTVSYSFQISVDGSTNLSGFTTSSYGDVTSFTASTGTLVTTTANANGNGVVVSNLAVGLHTVKISKVSGATTLFASAFDIITPVHAPKGDLPGDFQSTQSVGSCALGDSRKFGLQTVKALSNWAQAIGVSANPTTTSTSYVPFPDMACVIKTSGNPIQISYAASVENNTAAASVLIAAYVDGVRVGTESRSDVGTTARAMILANNFIVPVAAGTHVVQLFWSVSAGTANADSSNAPCRILSVREIN